VKVKGIGTEVGIDFPFFKGFLKEKAKIDLREIVTTVFLKFS